MKSRKAKLTLAVAAFAGIVISVYCYFLPYPLWYRLRARPYTKYNPAWATSEADFNSARREASSRLGFYEFIDNVWVETATRIHFHTTTSWRGFLDGAGRSFTVQKASDGWTIVEISEWIS